MNSYDFDKTIFYPDSSVCFYKYCLKKYPSAIIKTLPGTICKGIKYAAKKIETKELKEHLFSFLKYLPDVDAAVESFWNENFKGIGQWYLDQKKEDDLIISASPYFLLYPVCSRLGVTLIATPMDKKTGKIQGKNCHDSEKVRRFYEEYPEGKTENFYSDSLSDTPMAEIADKAWMVTKHKLSPWPNK